MTTKVAHFSATEAAAAPLSFSYPLTPTVSFGISVFGDARQYAAVAIVYGSMTMWSVTLMQTTPTAQLTNDLLLGDVTIKKGATFKLTIPSTAQMGAVVVACTIVQTTNPDGTSFQAQVANWPLTSASN